MASVEVSDEGTSGENDCSDNEYQTTDTIPEPVAELQNSTVPTTQLQCAEFCFNVTVGFSKSARDDAIAVRKVMQIVCGARNKSGGIISVKDNTRSRVPEKELGDWKRMIHQQFTKYMSEEEYQECISYKLCEDLSGLYIFVKPSQNLASLQSNLYVRHDEESMIVISPKQICKILQGQASALPDIPNIADRVDDFAGLQESQDVEFKHWATASKVADYKAKFEDKRTRKSIFSLFSADYGGVFIIGIKEDKSLKQNIVKGQIVDDEAALAQYIEQFLGKAFILRLPAQSERTKMERLQRGTHYDIHFVPLVGPNQGQSQSVLIVLRCARCDGGVFEEEPESYTVTNQGFIRRLTLTEWQKKVENISMSKPTVLDQQPRQTTMPPIQPEAAGSVVKEKNTFFKRYKEKMVNLMKSQTLSDDNKEIDELFWTSGKVSWSRNLQSVSREVQDNIEQALDKSEFLKLTKPVNFVPTKNAVLAALLESNGTEDIVDIIEKVCETNKGLAIASLSWLSMLPDNEPPHTDCENHIMDVLVITDKPEAQIWLTTSADDEEQDALCLAYGFYLGRLLKSNFVEISRKWCTNIPNIQVQCFLCKKSGEVSEGVLQKMASSAFPVSAGSDMRLLLAHLLLSKTTWLKQRLDDELHINMTTEQMKRFLELGLSTKFNLIEGPPGSGKTFLALALTFLLNGRVDWVVTTAAFKAFLLYRGVEQVHIVRNDGDLKDLIKSDQLKGPQFLIFDDVHNIYCKSSSWKKLFRFVAASPCMHLYMFEDNHIQNYKQEKATCVNNVLTKFCTKQKLQLHMFSLTEVHRNTQKIASFIQANAEILPDKICCANKNEGHDVEVRKMSNIRSSALNPVIQFIKETSQETPLLSGYVESYQESDIAILTDGPTAQADVTFFTELLLEHLTTHVHTADVFPVTGIIVDCVENYMGLDSKMCIFIVPTKGVGFSTLHNPKYRAFLASRSVSRAVFIVEMLNPTIARMLQFDNEEEIDSRRCLFVGDGAVGISCLITSAVTNTFPCEYIPTVIETYNHRVVYNNRPYRLNLLELAGQEDYVHLRKLAYASWPTDIVVLCFSVVEPSSYENTKATWIPEISRGCSNIPVILVGTQIDLREQMKQNSITFHEGAILANEINAVKYVECSALTQEGLTEVFEEIVRIAWRLPSTQG